mmetsp:Transcript_10536/g.17676  ORF Transcript_10536/g.17676 Transcript_10536/m.17676 type:complete len:195 (+) Transcript_10536:364-948(+)
MMGSPFFEISKAYPELDLYYGLLVGMCYTVPHAVAGLYTGALTKTFNRKIMLVTVTLLLSAFQLTTGTVNSFTVLATLRFLHGAVSSAVNPLAFSLVADSFPKDKRNTANAVISSANFFGIALSSLTIILIKAVGWRMAYNVMGVCGLVGAALGALFIKNPKKGQFDDPKTEEQILKEEEKKKNRPRGFKNFVH